jgi:SAM-dependent methyltransferase
MSNDSGRAQHVRRKTYEVLWNPALKGRLERVPFLRRIYNGWARPHPFDAAHGVDTSGLVPATECAPEPVLAAQISPYGGSQPSIVRAALAWLPNHHHYTFVDLGCGKGRALVVASEFPFRRLIGVEIAPRLADVARVNAATIAARYPQRTPIEVEVGDATAVVAPAEHVVYFMYHPFGGALVRALVANIERQKENGLRHAFFVYYNPVHADVLDHSPRFSRWCAEMVPYAPGEVGYGPDLRDTLVTWQTRPEKHPARPYASRPIVVHQSAGGHASLDGG